MSFRNFNLSESILKALQEKGYQMPTPIQRDAIPQIIADKDVLGSHKPEPERLLHSVSLFYKNCKAVSKSKE
jgi:hypothetical protein